MLQLEIEKPRPPKMVIYGVEGIGKTHLGAMADAPIFLKVEDGLEKEKYKKNYNKNVESFPKVKTWAEVTKNLQQLATEEHNFKTLVIDSLDRLELLIHDQVCRERNVQSIASIDYGKGYEFAMDIWREYLEMLDYLNVTKGLTIINIAHAKIGKYANPETESYDRYSVRMHESASGKTSAARLFIEDADMVLFINYLVGTTTTKDSERQRAIGDSRQRFIYTEERPVAIAKNRFDLPNQIPFDKDGNFWNVIKSHVPYFNQTQGE